jgi:hypothetical protein
MTLADYILDSALVLLVLVQMKGQVLTNRSLLRGPIILAIAVASYFSTLPTQGNDLILILAVSAIGAVLGVLSGVTVFMATNPEGAVTARAGIASAVFWVLGMGGRFGFAVWASSAAGARSLGSFALSAHLSGSAAVWTDALLGMAVCEVLGRTVVLLARRAQVRSGSPRALASLDATGSRA